MAIDSQKAYEIENGIVLSKDGAYLVGGNGSPVGFFAPTGSWYLRLDTKTLWFKFDVGDNDWKQISADDITALDISVDPNNTETIQFLFNKILGGQTGAVSQTLIFGSGGNSSQNSYLPNESVPSNVVGVPVGLANASIRSVFLGNENTRTGNVLIQERTPAGTGTYTTIYTLQLTAQNYANVTSLNVPITANAEIAIFTEVSLKNVKVVLNVNGDAT